MIFYLRMVHSIDFYNHSEYPNEDEMPNRSAIKRAFLLHTPKFTRADPKGHIVMLYLCNLLV